MARSAQNPESKICEAVLKLAAQKGWAALTMERIAAAAKVSPAQLNKIFPNKNSLLPALIRHTDRQLAVRAGKVDKRSAPHDRLFEVLMARFDILQDSRAGVMAIIKDMRRDPSALPHLLPAEMRSMQQVLALAHMPADKCAPLIQGGLLAVYGHALWQWQRDDSADMAKTMATLDKGLRYAGFVAERLFQGRK